MPSDAELVARSRRHDAEAFGALVERHQRLVFGVALARCRDPDLAEDVAQDAFVAAWRDLDRLRDGDRVGPWVAGIARNLAANAIRARARRRDPEPIVDAVPTPEDAALEREDRELLRRALADVPAAHREALVLYYFDGESIARIAAVLGVGEAVVKQRLSRGRRALRAAVADRVEVALGRLRPAVRAGVVAAVATSLGSREAAASAATKGLAIMSAKKLALAIGALVLVTGGAALWIARDGSEAAPPAAPAAVSAPRAPGATAPPSPATPSPPPRVRRLPDRRARDELLATIRDHYQRRTGAPAATTSAAPAPALPPVATLDKAYIRAAVRELLPLLSDCYAEGLTRDPALAGDVVVDFTIEGEPGVGGVIGDSKIDPERTEIADPTVRECIQETMYALEIDPPAGGGTVHVTYPFRFSPGEP